MIIYKYPLLVEELQEISLPIGSELLSVQMQNGSPMLWVLINNEKSAERKYKITTIGTGNPIDEDPGEFIDTYQMANGHLVFHVFYK